MTHIFGTARVEAYVHIGQAQQSGFMLPLLRQGGEARWLVQCADSNDLVKEFSVFDVNAADITPVTKPVFARCGEPQIYAFADGKNIHIGSRTFLSTTMKDFAIKNAINAATVLQIYSMIGSLAERRSARREMAKQIEKRGGRKSAHIFYLNTLDSLFWTKLISEWKLDSDPARRDRIKAEFKINYTSEGILSACHVHPASNAEKMSLETILSHLNQEFEGAFKPRRPTDPFQMVIDDTVDVEMLRTKNLVVTESGKLIGNAIVENADIAGTVDGIITTNNMLVRATGKLSGKCRCRRLQVEDGGTILGQIEMLSEASITTDEKIFSRAMPQEINDPLRPLK